MKEVVRRSLKEHNIDAELLPLPGERRAQESKQKEYILSEKQIEYITAAVDLMNDQMRDDIGIRKCTHSFSDRQYILKQKSNVLSKGISLGNHWADSIVQLARIKNCVRRLLNFRYSPESSGDRNMGSQITARCECGVQAEVLIGGGMMNFTTTCFFPCLCANCQGIVQVNLLAKSLRCPQCRARNPIPYDDPSLSKSPGDHLVASWNMQDQLGRELVLTDGKYRCPKCGKMTLEFVDSGLCWD